MVRRVDLPLISEHRAALETCAYCPKLCRAACPVSNVEPTETLTPGGKMTDAWLLGKGEIDVNAESVRSAWACTGCLACRERCDHSNPVESTLYAARARWQEAGVAPPASARVIRAHAARRRRNAERLAALQEGSREGGARSRIGLLLGCAYLKSPEHCREAIELVGRLLGPVRLLDACCGAPLSFAGSPNGAMAERRSLQIAAQGCEKLVVLDPGCARELVERGVACSTVVELGDAALHRFGRVEGLGEGGSMRWHDACQLTRGLGLYEPPRRLLERALGRPADEFGRNREISACSGAGGLLPLTMPRASRAIADDRVAEHEQLGGGTIVTACASSFRRLHSRGARVVDLITVMNRSLDA
jgi:Fe-S oxidoreductase